jgi:hypothetical protein
VPMTSKRASGHVSATDLDIQKGKVPGEASGTVEASTLVCGSSAGPLDELVAEMLMHRAAIGVRRAVAELVRCVKLFQGETAGRSMAGPVNWRACKRCQSLDGARSWMPP